MITERRAGVRLELESERLRSEALEKEKQEAERIAVQKKDEEVREQLRREQDHKQAEAQRNTKLQELRSSFLSRIMYWHHHRARVRRRKAFLCQGMDNSEHTEQPVWLETITG
jgi:hypothetical protein